MNLHAGIKKMRGGVIGVDVHCKNQKTVLLWFIQYSKTLSNASNCASSEQWNDPTKFTTKSNAYWAFWRDSSPLWSRHILPSQIRLRKMKRNRRKKDALTKIEVTTERRPTKQHKNTKRLLVPISYATRTQLGRVVVICSNTFHYFC